MSTNPCYIPSPDGMPTYYTWTIGCQMNKADTEHAALLLEAAGYRPAVSLDQADFILLNSCVVRQSAENKVVNKMRALKALKRKSPAPTIAVTGCLVGPETDGLSERFPWIDIFFPPQHMGPLFDWLAENGHMPVASAPAPRHPDHPCGYVSIIQGCNSYCSYCIVPYRRGREKSRELDDIVNEVRGLVAAGVREVTLLGQNIGAYGRDLDPSTDLADLLEKVNGVEGLARLRFLTNHPKDTDRRLLEAIARSDKVCESISLPLQAGDDRILREMRRGYTGDDYLHLIDLMRSIVPDMAISTDIIVGFPGETDSEFRRTLDILRQVRFDRIHVAAYSTREGTLASKSMVDDVPAEVKAARLQEVERLHEEIAAEINAGLVGQAVEILVEERNKGKWQGRTRGDKLVFFSSPDDLTGRLVHVRIEKATAWSLQGKLVRQGPSSASIA